jgi:hypothetical protein
MPQSEALEAVAVVGLEKAIIPVKTKRARFLNIGVPLTKNEKHSHVM